MHDVRLLFDAMDQNLFVAIYVTAMFLFTVWVVCQLIQLAWRHAEPHVFLLLNFRKESAREVSSEMLPASSRMAATALRTQVRRDIHDRFKSRLAERRAATATDGLGNPFCFHSEPRFNHDERGDWPIAQEPPDRRAQVGVMPKDAA